MISYCLDLQEMDLMEAEDSFEKRSQKERLFLFFFLL